jgi:hypothetical protein
MPSFGVKPFETRRARASFFSIRIFFYLRLTLSKRESKGWNTHLVFSEINKYRSLLANTLLFKPIRNRQKPIQRITSKTYTTYYVKTYTTYSCVQTPASILDKPTHLFWLLYLMRCCFQPTTIHKGGPWKWIRNIEKAICQVWQRPGQILIGGNSLWKWSSFSEPIKYVLVSEHRLTALELGWTRSCSTISLGSICLCALYQSPWWDLKLPEKMSKMVKK